ncbi:SRPBCC domain-containing protein [Paenibacillus sp. FSL R7-0337]|uniref:SRPBCC domain-containing protein n=1 Tax=Paenibacillus sp. FSL R7-0337 TaxID=1926588 RepID=UPI00096C1383|nr:SRPBCC domain-containing protein [Paenibacillus sp. FSL R7-0337]OMF97004.1 ATPase [Paenibacillus sp. FSL R7-0337]
MSETMVSRVEGLELVLERVFAAPHELVFKVFTEAEHLKQWWGPRGWIVPFCSVDFRPGGIWHYCMKCVDEKQGEFFGMESWGKGIYHEITDGESFVYTDYFSDAKGNETEGMPSTLVSMIFEETEGGRTKLISRSKYESEEALRTVMDMGMIQGITETWDRLGEHLQSIQ